MKRGFTLLEMLLSISLLTLITAFSIPVYQSFQVRNDLNITQSQIIESLRRAQQLSMSSVGDSVSGVRIEPTEIILFRGANYIARDPLFDEIYIIAPTIIPSGLDELFFSKLTGTPNITGSINLSSSINELKTITINEKGILTF